MRNLLFTLKSNTYLTKDFLANENLEEGEYLIDRFSDGELFVRIGSDVKEKECYVLGSSAPPDENLTSLLLLAHTLKKEGAKKVTALIPYLGYARQDKNKVGESLGVDWLGKVLKASGVDSVITIDIHSNKGKKLLSIPTTSLSSASIFAPIIRDKGLSTATLVVPDEGAVTNGRNLQKESKISGDVAYYEKHRDDEGISIADLHGTVGENVIIYDDIISTGSTLVACCKKLKNAGVKDITIMVTHGLFVGSKWEELWSLGVSNIYTTNSTPQALEHASEKITILSISTLLDISS